jgi:photosystem II stability/assembly factor-like uncharacterized protein
MHWRLVGPFRGGRALAVTGVPGQPEKFYFGAVGGGVWETVNAGRTWKPIFDSENVASIGDIRIAPSDPNTIYVGSGEADMRSDIQQGDGMYKSTDGGKTWRHIGLEDTRQIGKILIDPQNPDVVYVAALGHQYGPNDQRGVFKTTDGGKTWKQVLSKGPDVGAIDLAMDPLDSDTLFACTWHTRRPPWSVYPPSHGPGSGLYKSTDGGATWTEVKGGGFPSTEDRIGIAISPSRGERIYAFVDSEDRSVGGIYRSDDGGTTWIHTDGEQRVWGRGWYFAGITADPKDPDTVYVMNTSAYRSTDGGRTFTPFKGAPGGDDYHTLWIDPNDSKRLFFGSDQGVGVSVDGGKSWSTWYNQPTGQFYHIVTDNRFPYSIFGTQQDSGAMEVPSRTIHTGISALYGRPVDAGGESGTIATDKLHPGTILSSTGTKEEVETGWEQNIDPTLPHIETQWRSEWTMPIAASPTDPHVFYASHQQIFRTDDGGSSWTIISPDLTRPTLTNPKNLDASAIADNEHTLRRGVVYWLGPSPLLERELWAGTDDGLVWITTDAGAHWQNITPPELTPWSKVAMVDASHFDAGMAYIAVDRHRLDDNRPYIYRTQDFGKHWRLITAGIPENQFVNAVREDPKKPGLLYAGTDWNVYVSFDYGMHWQSLQLNLPAASVRDIVFGGDDVVVGTHGRAIWILDDVTRLREMASGTRLFKPAKAVVFQRAGTFGYGQFDEGTPLPPEEPEGENPAWGAVLDYQLNRDSGPIELTVSDSSGKVLRRVSSTDPVAHINLKQLEIPAYWVKEGQRLQATAGAHRYVWDFHTDRLMVPPGTYTVTLHANGRAYSQPLTVARDPRNAASDADLLEQYAFAHTVIDEAAWVRGKAAAYEKRTAHLTGEKRDLALATIGSERGRRKVSGTSLRNLAGALDGLVGAVESAPSAPTKGYRQALSHFAELAREDMRVLDRLAGG